MWALPDTESITPSYERLDIGAELQQGGLVPVASGRGHHAAISIRQQGAVLWAGRLKPGEAVQVPEPGTSMWRVARPRWRAREPWRRAARRGWPRPAPPAWP